MATTQPQIAHEAEVHRQHVRLKVPIQVELDGVRLQVDDWSMGGFGVTGETTSRREGDRFTARLIFPFDGFDMAMLLDCELVYAVDQPKRFGARFVSLDSEQISLFRYLVDAYLSGEVISAGDVLQLRARESRAAARQTLVYDPYGEPPGWAARLRRLLGWLLLLLLAAGLAAFAWWSFEDGLPAGEVTTGLITAPSWIVRAPSPGAVNRLVDDDATTNVGNPVAEIVTEDAGSRLVLSPCACIVHAWGAPNGTFVTTGEPVATLVSAEAPLTVEAQLPPARAAGLSTGDRADILFFGQPDRLTARVAEIRASAPLGVEAPRDPELTVVLRTDQPLPFEMLGSLVQVRFGL